MATRRDNSRLPAAVDDHAVVVGLPGIHTRPDLGHPYPRTAPQLSLVPQTTTLALPYTAIFPHIPISGRVVKGNRAAKPLPSHRTAEP